MDITRLTDVQLDTIDELISSGTEQNAKIKTFTCTEKYENSIDGSVCRSVQVFEDTGEPIGGFWVGVFWLTQLPGCCAYLILHSMEVNPMFRSMGIGQTLHRAILEMARMAGYSKIMCTTIEQNEAQNHILKKLGWTVVDRVINKRTNNKILTWTRIIEE